MNATVKVIKGCSNLFAYKSDTPVQITFEATNGGVTVKGFFHTLWLSGNRVNLPKLKIGQRFNCHRGDPTKFITIEITDF